MGPGDVVDHLKIVVQVYITLFGAGENEFVEGAHAEERSLGKFVEIVVN